MTIFSYISHTFDVPFSSKTGSCDHVDIAAYCSHEWCAAIKQLLGATANKWKTPACHYAYHNHMKGMWYFAHILNFRFLLSSSEEIQTTLYNIQHYSVWTHQQKHTNQKHFTMPRNSGLVHLHWMSLYCISELQNYKIHLRLATFVPQRLL